MCFRNKLAEALKSKSPRSQLRRYQRELLKPKLSRRIVPNARVNLNAYWSQFEELSKQNHSCFLTCDIFTADRSNVNNTHLLHVEDEVNDNLINELMELGNK